MELFVIPPFFRFFGSHNNRVGPGVLATALSMRSRGHAVLIYNADSIPDSEEYADWYSIWRNYQSYCVDKTEAVLMHEMLDRVKGIGPEKIYICSGDPAIPTVDLGGIDIVEASISLFKTALPEIPLIGFGASFHLNPALRGMVDGVYVEKPPIGQELELSILLDQVHRSNFDYIMSALGCTWNKCVFCINAALKNSYETVLSPVEFARDVKNRVESGINYQYFADMTFTAHSMEYLQSLANLLRGVDLSFSIEARVAEITESKLMLMKSFGLSTVKIGVEGGTQRLLDLYNKGITIEDVEKKVKIIRDCGLKLVVYQIIGHPYAEESDYVEGFNFVESLHADYYVVNVSCPYVGTELFKLCDHDKMVADGLLVKGIEHGFTHLSHDLLRFWGVSDHVFEDYILLSARTVKEDENVANVRRFVRNIL